MNKWTEHPESSKEISSSKQSHHFWVWLNIQVLEGAGHAHLHAEGDTWHSSSCGGKFCLDLMALSNKMLGEYSQRWIPRYCFQEIMKIIPTSTTSNVPGNGSPLKTQSSYLLIHQLWLGWNVWISPSNALQDRLQWFLLPQDRGERICLLLYTVEEVINLVFLSGLFWIYL